MQEAEHDLTSMAFESSRGSSNSRFADDDKLFVQFSVGSVQNTQKTAQEGRPIFVPQATRRFFRRQGA